MQDRRTGRHITKEAIRRKENSPAGCCSRNGQTDTDLSPSKYLYLTPPAPTEFKFTALFVPSSPFFLSRINDESKSQCEGPLASKVSLPPTEEQSTYAGPNPGQKEVLRPTFSRLLFDLLKYEGDSINKVTSPLTCVMSLISFKFPARSEQIERCFLPRTQWTAPHISHTVPTSFVRWRGWRKYGQTLRCIV
jgi:hypothetical protein